MLWGILLAAALLFPTLANLSSGGRGSLQWDLLKNEFTGNVINVLQGFIIGAQSSSSNAALFCGSVALLGCIAFLTSKAISARVRMISGSFLFVVIMTAYWQPFFFLFSIFKSATSYWFRYSYVIIFSIIFIAACYYRRLSSDHTLIAGYFRNAAVFSAGLLAAAWVKDEYNLNLVYFTAGGILSIALLLWLRQQNCKQKKRVFALCTCGLIGLSCFELAYNSSKLFDSYHGVDTQSFSTYTNEVGSLISAIQQSDSSSYRISQTTTRSMDSGNLTANYNESLAYHYMSISGYTSDPDDMQRTFLDQLGYRINGENFCVTNTSILGADSLLGVKYVLSPYSINGLEKLEEYSSAGGKDVYYNPYYLPMAFTYKASSAETENAANPFEYQEELYSALLGSDSSLYKKLTASKTVEDGKITYTIELPEGNFGIYGNLPWSWESNAVVTTGDYTSAYSKWGSPSVFYIPTDKGQSSVAVTITSENTDLEASIADEQFYALDLDRLQEVTDILRSRSAAELTLGTCAISCSVDAEEGESLYLSIPYNEGWTITRNGEEITADKFADCMYSIPLTEGENIIEMEFRQPFLAGGIAISLLACVSLVAAVYLGVRRKKRGCIARFAR